MPNEVIVFTRYLDGREQQRVTIPRLATPAFEPLFQHPELLGAMAEGHAKISWEIDLSYTEEIGLWILAHADELPDDIRAALRQDVELPGWTGI